MKADCLWLDCIVYPLVNMYRQGIESYLKHFLQLIPPLLDREIDSKFTHRLDGLWAEVRKLMAEVTDHSVEGAFKDDAAWVDTIVKNFMEIDPGGAAFRYPVDAEGVPYLLEFSHINVGVLGEEMAKLYKVFERWGGWVDYVHEMRSEMLSALAGEDY